MEKLSEKRRRPKHPSGQPVPQIPRYRDDPDNITAVDNSCKYYQANEIHPSKGRNERRQSNSMIDYNKNHYGCNDVPKTSRKHAISNLSRIKYFVPQTQEEFENKNENALRQPRNQGSQQLANNTKYTKNAAVRKNHYIDDYSDAHECENSTVNENINVADETSEEVVDEEHLGDLTEFNEKDYEEHEADHEIDEETDVWERGPERSRFCRKMRMESLPRNHKISSAPLASRFHRGGGKNADRYCRSACGRKTADIPTEEEEEELEIRRAPACARKKSSGSSRQRDGSARIAGRKLSERYSDLPERSLLVDERQTRRPKSMRPVSGKPSKLLGIQYESICSIKCDRCGGTSRLTPRTTSSRNATCRLQDSQYFIDRSNGDDVSEEPTGDPSSRQTTLRRSKESRSPIYESKEKGLAICDYETDDDRNEIRANSKSRGVRNSRETKNLKHFLTRADGRYEEKTIFKSNKGHWAER
ncbi:uncharacterized protein [Venturia canescens]|uniref:uncharacterized protein n=1 Tax=Venturia canescens TaxID=32260 RepID=UPI001C9D27C6|nr:uncharacterized protein LOC122413462 [Venturia canescens]